MAKVYKCDFCGKCNDTETIGAQVDCQKNIFFVEKNNSCICAECVSLAISTDEFKRWLDHKREKKETRDE